MEEAKSESSICIIHRVLSVDILTRKDFDPILDSFEMLLQIKVFLGSVLFSCHSLLLRSMFVVTYLYVSTV